MKASRLWRSLAVVSAALIVATLGLIASVRISGPGPLLATAPGRWFVERIAPSSATHAVAEGDAIGPLRLTDFDGHPRPLPLVHGHRMLVNVWASWCEPCRAEMPLLALLAKSRGKTETLVVGIAQDDPPAVRGYLLQTPVNYPILFDNIRGDAGRQLGNRLGVLPYSVLIDEDGRLLRRKYGPFKDSNAIASWVSAP